MRTAPLLLVFAAVVLGSPVALAQKPVPPAPAPPTPPAPAAPATPAPGAPAAATPAPAAGGAVAPLAQSLTGQAKADYDSARLLLGVSDFAGALIKFTSAYNASKDPRLLYDMGVCESKLHHYAKSLGYMQQYLKDAGPMLSPQDQADTQQAIAAMQPLTSTMTIRASQPGADVYVDDELVGQSPLPPFLVDIGTHKVRVHKPDFQDFAVDNLTVTGGAQFSVDATLAPVVHEGRLSVRAGPQDQIAIDGAPSGVGAWSGPLRSGGHTLRVTAPGMTPYQTEVLLQDGQARDISVTLNPEPHHGLPAWVWITGGVVVAGGLGVGGYFLFKPTSKYEGPAGSIGPPGIVQANAPVRF